MPSVQVPSLRPGGIAQRFASHCASLMQAEPGAPSEHTPPSGPSAHSLSTQWLALLQRWPTPPALQLQPAPA